MAENTETNGAPFHGVFHFLGGESCVMVSVLNSKKGRDFLSLWMRHVFNITPTKASIGLGDVQGQI